MKHNRTHCSGSTSTDIFSAHPDPELLTELRQTMSTINTVSTILKRSSIRL